MQNKNKMPKNKHISIYKSSKNTCEKSDVDVPSSKTDMLPRVRKWRSKCRDSLTVELFDKVVEFLASKENRLSRPKCNGYYPEYDACHLHFTEGISVFYRYEKTDLSILAVMQHTGDKNDYKII